MAQAAQKFPDFCRETAPAPSGTANYFPTGSIAPFVRLGTQLSDGDAFSYLATNGDASTVGDWEIAEGIYREGPPIEIERPSGDATKVYRSSNGGALVSWPGTGNVTLQPAPHGTLFQNLVGGVQSIGLAARTGEHAWAWRQLTALGELLSWANPDGQAGDPQIQQAYDVLRRAGGTDAQRTMSDPLLLAALITHITGLPHEIRGPNGAGDVFRKITKTADQDYVSELGVGGSLRRELTLRDVPYEDSRESTSNNIGDVESDTEISVTVPSFGSWRISVEISLGFVIVSGSNNSNSVIGIIEFSTGGAFSELKRRDELLATSSLSTTVGGSLSVRGFVENPTPGTTYTFRASAAFSGPGTHDLSLGSGDAHSIEVRLSQHQ